ncbi:hypothetical protein ETAA8_11740 [Anatilimnocola aggregata]|uniref:Uncharacterized protein n=1 Tax=Anatilimnocola aggregata TaxID=2528021 RepID=A0A517Y790_9BACT|nr:hypothetical protein [Anatilimnocola aggregata]QDU26100.1 hypothetical protein ETAA8_11740 [Anatilimnocola aggregata]
MHAILLTVLALSGGDGGSAVTDYSVAPAGHHAQCDECGNGAGAGGKHHQPRWMMPQTCYGPKFGCYGTERHTHRYPAFHGTYFRRPYNYRNVFDYPWHAEMHEPTSLFSYHVQANQQPQPAAPQPEPGMIQHSAGAYAPVIRR